MNLICPICFTQYSQKVSHITDTGQNRDALICPHCEHGWIENPASHGELEQIYGDLERWPATPPSKSLKFQMLGKELERLCPTKSKILDVGCGNGDFLFNLSEGWERFGIELGKNRAQMATKRARADVRADLIENVDFPNNYFDCITMFALIEHLLQPSQVLNKIHDLLKPGGIILVMTGDRTSKKALREKSDWYLYAPIEHFHFFSRESLKKILNDTGFDVLKVDWRFSFGYRTNYPIVKQIDRAMTLCFQGLCEVVPSFRKLNFGDTIYITARKNDAT